MKNINIAKRYFIQVLVFVVLFYIVYGTKTFYSWIMEPVMKAYANIGHWILSIFGQNVKAEGTEIISKGLTLNISIGCDGVEAMALFAIALVAMPVSFLLRLRGLGIGLLILVLVNIIRIVSLYFIGTYWNDTFEFFHVYFWQVAYILVAGMIWYWWADKYLLNPIKTVENE